jgi:hypothetical protein
MLCIANIKSETFDKQDAIYKPGNDLINDKKIVNNKMKHLNIELLKTSSFNTAINEVSFFLDSVHKQVLDQVPWPEYNYHPGVEFAIAYGNDGIFLKYYVNEAFIRAANGAANTPVYQDSCVEFFINFGDEKTYYNFEFNCIGTALVGYGTGRTDRELLPEQLIRQIRYQSVINNEQPGDDIHWELTVAIPFALFYHHQLNDLTGKKCRANFYKCGDHLPIPHFIAWSNISSPEPDFHVPEFFGTLQFV